MGADSITRVVLADPVTGAGYAATGGGGGGGTSAPANTIFTDNSGAVYIRRDDGTTVSYVTPAGVAATPGAGLRPYGASAATTIADGADVTLGTTTDAANDDYTATATNTSTLKGFLKGIGARADAAWVSGQGSVIALLKAAVAGINGATPAGTNAIGTVGVTALPSTPAGVNLIGKIGIDQTTPGTTNKVVADTVIQAASNDRGAIIGFSGAVITTVLNSNTITLTTAPTSGTVILGQIITAANVPAGSYLYALASGTLNAAGSTYTLSSSPTSLVAANATASASGTAGASVGPQQIMAANTARRTLAYQVQSLTASVYVNGTAGTATADYHSLKINPGSYYESAPTHVGTGAVFAIADTPATPLYAREG